MRYKRGCPGQKPYLSIFVRYEEAQRSWEHFRVSFELLLLQNTSPDHLYLRATSPSAIFDQIQHNVYAQATPILYSPFMFKGIVRQLGAGPL